MKPGDAFLVPDAFGKHLNVVLAVLDDGIIHCHLTTLNRHSDRSCIVEPGEHSFIKNRTSVKYDQATICAAGDQLDALKRCIEKNYEPVSQALLKRIQQGALNSPQTPDKVKVLLRPLV